MTFWEVLKSTSVAHFLASVLVSYVGDAFLLLNDPFYHRHWLEDYGSWVLLPLALTPILFVISLTKSGLICLTFLGGIDAFVFALLHENALYQTDPWPQIAWLAHLLFIPILVTTSIGAIILVRDMRESNTSPK